MKYYNIYIYTQILRIVQTLIQNNFYNTDLKLDNFVIDQYFKVNIIDYESIIEMKDNDNDNEEYEVLKTKQFKDIIGDGSYKLRRKKILKLIALSLIQLEDEIFNYKVYFGIKSENFNLNDFINHRLNQYDEDIKQFKTFVGDTINIINESNQTNIQINYIELIVTNNNLINILNYVKLNLKENSDQTVEYIFSYYPDFYINNNISKNNISKNKHYRFLIYLFIVFTFIGERYVNDNANILKLDTIRKNPSQLDFENLLKNDNINNNNNTGMMMDMVI